MSTTKRVVYSAFNRPKGPTIACTAAEGKTQQDFKEECDVNYIVERFANTGLWSNSLRPPVSKPMFGDFTNVPDFHNSMNVLAKAREHFESLPAKVRARFSNSPAEMLRFVSDESNYAEAVKLGIANPRPDTAATAAPSQAVPDGSPRS